MTQTINSNAVVPATSPDNDSAIGIALNAKSQTEIDTAAGAIAIKSGTVMLTGAVAQAMTLAAPIAGTDDFKTVRIYSNGAYAHTVTTPALGLNGVHHIATFAAAGDHIELTAYQGTWLVGENSTTIS
jgi:hypothetical protein